MKYNHRRYKTETFQSKSLIGNKINDDSLKNIKIYLPPEYFNVENEKKNYPVIYLLHGYSGNINDLLVVSKKELKKNYPFMFRIILWKIFRKLLTYEKLDDLILKKGIKPFILIQPDASLPIKNIFEKISLNGKPSVKGSSYLNSKYTGNYEDYIFKDLVEYIDKTYRTLPEKKSRALIGGSMGGYGSLIGGIKYPEKFNAVVSLSPAINWFDLIDIKMFAPLFKIIYGKKKEEKMGKEDLEDILDTADLIFSDDNRLIPSIKRDETGRIYTYDKEARKNWARHNLNNLVKEYPNSFKNLHLLINCEESDEYRFAKQIRHFHETLKTLNINHEINIYSDKFASRISPHMIGIATNILPGFKYCLKFLLPEN